MRAMYLAAGWLLVLAGLFAGLASNFRAAPRLEL